MFMILLPYLVIFLNLSESSELLLHLVEAPDGRVELGLLLLPLAVRRGQETHKYSK